MSAGQLTFEEAIQLQQERWAANSPILAEELIELCAEAAASEDLQLDIIYGEVIQLENGGTKANESEFVARFPELSDQILRQFQVHRAMDSYEGELVTDSDSACKASFPEPGKSAQVVPSSVPGFELIELLGQGGSGVAFKAHDENLDRIVAIKLLNGIASLDQNSRRRFLREAESAASLSHPAIVPVYQIGNTDSGDTFLVMSYVDGGSLFEVLRDGPLNAHDAIELLIPVVEAVKYAHDKGIVHRDLKPANILLDQTGKPFVCDFGLAKRIGPEQTVNATETIVGTPAYMPPEQARHSQSDARSDVYSLGVVLYELLSGRSPFQAPSVWETLANVMANDAVPLRQLNPSIDRDLETICQRCMEKSPSSRYQSAGELLDELNRYKTGQPIMARPIGMMTRVMRWSKREPKLASLLAVATILLFLLGAVTALAILSIRNAESNTLAQKGLTTKAKIAAVVNALPDALPVAMSNLEEGDSVVVSQLRGVALDQAAQPAMRLNAALALADQEVYFPETVVSMVCETPLHPGTCRNIIDAFRDQPDQLVVQIQESFASFSEVDQFRFACLAMFLGHVDLAVRLTAPDGHPDERTRFIKLFKEWNPGLSTINELLQDVEDEGLLSALVIGVGRMDPAAIPTEARQRLEQTLRTIYESNGSATAHSAALWAMYQWNANRPQLDESDSTGQWRITASGEMMIRFDPVVTVLGFEEENSQNLEHEVTLTTPFEIGSKEVTVASFQKFVDSLDENDPLSNWAPVEAVSPTTDCPAENVTWLEAIRYCNWLSQSEGLEVCYSPQEPATDSGDEPGGWRCNFSASGYRLPTEAEWEYAGRAGSRKATCFGDDPAVVLEYVRFSQLTTTSALPVGSLIPNGYGLFDMEGNVWEWCWDQYGSVGAEPLVDPKGPDGTLMQDHQIGRVIRGGGVVNQSGEPYIKGRGQYGVERLASNIGFRVVRTLVK